MVKINAGKRDDDPGITERKSDQSFLNMIKNWFGTEKKV